MDAQTSVVCSRGMAGTLSPQLLDEKLDENATSFKDAATAVGYGGNSHQVSCTCCAEVVEVTVEA